MYVHSLPLSVSYPPIHPQKSGLTLGGPRCLLVGLPRAAVRREGSLERMDGER